MRRPLDPVVLVLAAIAAGSALFVYVLVSLLVTLDGTMDPVVRDGCVHEQTMRPWTFEVVDGEKVCP